MNTYVSEDASIPGNMNSQAGVLAAAGVSQNEPSKHKERRNTFTLRGEYKESPTKVIRSASVVEAFKAPSYHLAAIQIEGKSSQPILSLEKDNITETNFKQVLTEDILNELSKFLKDIEKFDIPNEVLVDCGFCDIAGQRNYDATHPIFLNSNDVHLLVADITKDITQINTEDGFDKIGRIKNTRLKQKNHVCDKESSVNWCHGCQRSMCQDCNNQHWISTDTKYQIVKHVQDMYSLDFNFKVNVEGISDIKVLHDDLLVIADHNGKKLVAYYVTLHQQHTIQLDSAPDRIAVVDNNTVAVRLYKPITLKCTSTVVIVDVIKREVIQRIDVKVRCDGITWRDNQLFVGCRDNSIKVMNISGMVTCTIPVGVAPDYICGDTAGRIYCTDSVKLYCYYKETTLLTITDPNMSTPCGIATDDEGHVLVICNESNNVLRISPDGKQCQIIITQIPSSDCYPYICYNSLSKSVVIGRHDNVYVYKKV